MLDNFFQFKDNKKIKLLWLYVFINCIIYIDEVNAFHKHVFLLKALFVVGVIAKGYFMMLTKNS